MIDSLLRSINDKTATVGVVGLGYVGLPLIKTFVEAGYATLGFDTDPRKVEQLQQGHSYIKHIPSEWISGCIESGAFQPTADMSRAGEADALLICVPTPLSASRDPDLSFVASTAAQLQRTLRKGQLIVLESTTYPGTTRDVVLPILGKSGLKVGQDFFLAYSPEREDPGNPDFSAGTIPKVVGGIEENSLRAADGLYAQAVVQTVPVANCEVAEACKLLENIYRSVNIALVNELKILFQRMDIDVWEVINAAKTKPFGFQAFYPGPGLGGHCIPIDPFYLTWLARRQGMTTRFIELAGEINSSMPEFVVRRVGEALNAHRKPINGSRVAILGMAYKRDVDDPRESPSFELLELLQAAGAEVSYHDPYIPVLPQMRSFRVPQMQSSPLTEEFLAQQDCTLVATDHSALNYAWVVKHSQLVVDTRNATAEVDAHRDRIWKA